MVIHAVIVYFTLCFSIRTIVFMYIVSFKIIVIIIIIISSSSSGSGSGSGSSVKRDVLRFVSMLFLIFEKAMSKKIAPGILRFVSILFNVIINIIIF